MAGVSVDGAYDVSAKELSQFVEDRNDGAVELLVSKYTDVEGLAKALKVDTKNGLKTTGNDLETRREVFGTNRIEGKKPKTFCELCYEALQDFTLIMLMVSAIISLVLGIGTEGIEKGWIEGTAILISVTVVVLVAASTDYAKNKQFMALSALVDDVKIDVQRDGKTTKCSTYDLVVGDIMWITYGDLLAADGVLLEGNGVKCDEAALTGEPIQIAKDPASKPFMLSGTKVMEGSGKMLVVAVGPNSQSGIIKNLASGNDGIQGWETLDGRCSAENSSATVTYSPKKMKLTEFVQRGDKIRLGDEEYVVSDDGFFDETHITLDRPYDGATRTDVELSILPEGEDEEGSVLQAKLETLAVLIGQGGTAIAVFCVVLMSCLFLFDKFIVLEEAWVPEDWSTLLDFFITGITILVVAVPEGLPLAVTLSLSFSTKKMLKDNNLVKHLSACETMGSATTICSDKTGTLTTNRMAVMRSYIGRKHFDANVVLEDGELKTALVECASLNSGKTTNVEKDPKGGPLEYLGNKTECALLRMMMDIGVDYKAVRDTASFNYPQGLKLFPFNSGRKRMSIVVPHEAGPRIYTKGASEIVLGLCESILMPDGSVEPLTDEEKIIISDKVINSFATEGLRTLCLAYKNVESDAESKDEGEEDKFEDQDALESGLTLIAVVGIEDPVRPEVPGAIRQCHRAGISVRMVTGDNLTTAKSIAKKCGILPMKNPDRFISMEGPDFRKLVLDDAGNMLQGEFDKIWPRLRVLARSSPKDKFTLITGLLNSKLHIAKKNGELDGTADYPFVGRDRQVVAVTGDGTNDAPALSKADVGFAMGILGTEVAKDACDIVLQDDNFSSIVKACMWGRNVYDSIGKFLQFQLTVNLVAIILACVGAIAIRTSPLKPVQMLWVNLIMDSLASLALATEPPTQALLERKPYGRNDAVINKTMFKNIVGGSVYQLIVSFYLLFWGPEQFGWKTTDSAMQMQCSTGSWSTDKIEKCVTAIHYTMIFNTFVLMTLINEVVCRKLHDELNVFDGLFKNPLFVGILIVTAVSQVVLIQTTNHFFEVHELTLDQWYICMAFAAPTLLWGIFMHMIKPTMCSAVETEDGGDALLDGDSILRSDSSVLGVRTSKRLETSNDAFRRGNSLSKMRAKASNKSIEMGFPKGDAARKPGGALL
jgi:calcium-translocating P-type ATPase